MLFSSKSLFILKPHVFMYKAYNYLEYHFHYNRKLFLTK